MSKTILIALVTLGIGTGLGTYGTYRIIKSYQQHNIESEYKYLESAAKITDYYYRFDTTTKVSVIRDTMKAVDKYLPKYFPNGPYTSKDLFAIAMVESNFDQYLQGSRKEYGIFQIMPDMCKSLGILKNQYDIDVNTDMALQVLKDKYSEQKDYKMALIAYNGVVKSKGKVKENYWNAFVKNRKVLDDILGDSYK